MRRLGLATHDRNLDILEAGLLDQPDQLHLGKPEPDVRVNSTFLMEQPEI